MGQLLFNNERDSNVLYWIGRFLSLAIKGSRASHRLSLCIYPVLRGFISDAPQFSDIFHIQDASFSDFSFLVDHEIFLLWHSYLSQVKMMGTSGASQLVVNPLASYQIHICYVMQLNPLVSLTDYLFILWCRSFCCHPEIFIKTVDIPRLICIFFLNFWNYSAEFTGQLSWSWKSISISIQQSGVEITLNLQR